MPVLYLLYPSFFFVNRKFKSPVFHGNRPVMMRILFKFQNKKKRFRLIPASLGSPFDPFGEAPAVLVNNSTDPILDREVRVHDREVRGHHRNTSTPKSDICSASCLVY